MPAPRATVPRLAALAVCIAACGGLVQPADLSVGPNDSGQPVEDAPVSTLDAGGATVDASSTEDTSPPVATDAASLPDSSASGPPAWCASRAAAQMALTAIALQGDGGAPPGSPDPVQPGVWVFGRDGDLPVASLIEFFRNLDVSSCHAGLPSASDCSACQQVATCTYDPTNPQQVPQNPDSLEFVGPDGNEWVYAYLPVLSSFVLAKQSVSPTVFDLIVFYNEALFHPPPCVPECGCEPGDAAAGD
jgi:hypothetical protein